MDKEVFKNLEEMEMGQDISIETFFERIRHGWNNLHSYIEVKIKKPFIFLQQSPRDIRTNAFARHVAPLWQANSDTQFILDPYAATSYHISYLTKIDKYVTHEPHIMLENYKNDQVEASQRIKKLHNAFLIAQ